MQETLSTQVSGHVLIKGSDGATLVNRTNAIHPGNMGTAIARGLSNAAKSPIWKLKLGNQGTYIDSALQIVFRPPNTSGVSADLYNPTYYEIVDDAAVGVGVGNSVTFTNIPLSTSTRVIITCVVSANEAVNVGGNAGLYFFDELGLFTQGIGTPDLLNETDELMLSHLIFSPIEHTGSRELTIVYTLTITVT